LTPSGKIAIMEFHRDAPNRSGAYRSPALQRIADISIRQLNYWDRTGLLTPSVAAAAGSGSQRLYSRDDVVFALAIRRLLVLGVSLRSIRELAEQSLPKDPIGLREAIRRRRKRWSATVLIGDVGGAGIWLDLTALRKWLNDAESVLMKGEPPAA
jgi:DNA-binding transcriptional MerR regulator